MAADEFSFDPTDPSIARLTPAEQDYYLNGITIFRTVNAMALADEWQNRYPHGHLIRHGYSHYWNGSLAIPGCEWDDIVDFPRPR